MRRDREKDSYRTILPLKLCLQLYLFLGGNGELHTTQSISPLGFSDEGLFYIVSSKRMLDLERAT